MTPQLRICIPLQGLYFLMGHKEVTRDAPFISPSAKTTILTSTDPLTDPIMLSIRDLTYFPSDNPNRTPTRTLRRYPYILPTVKYTLAHSHIT